MGKHVERLRRGSRSHPHLVAVAALALGLALAPASPPVALAVVAAALPAMVVWAGREAGAVAALLVAAGLLIGGARLEPLERAQGSVVDGRRYEGVATVLERPRPGQFGSSAVVRLASVEAGPPNGEAGLPRGLRVLARTSAGTDWPHGGEPGIEVRVAGSLARPRSSPRSDFDWPAYLRRRGIVAELRVDSLTATGRRRGGIPGALDAMRRRAERATSAGLPSDKAALSRGMVLGQDERIAPETRDDFRDSGLGHLLAVSGQNVMLLAALALPLLAAARVRPAGRIAMLLGLIAIYVPLAGAGPSLQRAGVMGAAALAALAAGRPASRWYCLLLAATVTLALNPLALGDPGWQLSFAAVAGILTLAPGIRSGLKALPRPLAEAIAVTVAATVATAPLIGHHFGSVPLASLPANLAALPAVAPVMWIGMLQSAAGQLGGVPAVGPLADAACAALGRADRVPLGWLEEVARRFAELPGLQVELPLGSPAAVCAAYVLLAAAAFALRRAARSAEPHGRAAGAAWRRAPQWRRVALFAAAAVAAGAVAHAALGPPEPPDRLTVSFLDVGQGDATLIQDGHGAGVLFDGGPAEARVYRLVRQAGVRRLSAVVATHASADHHGGLREVLERIPVDLLVDGGDGTSDPAFRALLDEARSRGVRRVPAVAGQVLRIGELRIRILFPPPRGPGPAPEDPNLRATTALVSSGAFDLFLSADAESPSLLPLALPDVEAMKVPHHGSADPGLPELLERLRPEVAVIEVGENTYGHPAPATLSALERVVPSVYRTDRHGTVRLTLEDGEVRVATQR
jgi:competence protein ComEC